MGRSRTLSMSCFPGAYKLRQGMGRLSQVLTEQEVHLYTSYKLDESYTPASITFLAGSDFHDLQKVTTITLSESVEGWTKVNLGQHGTK